MTFKLIQSQKALVTGGNSGIGKAIAIALAKAGADVAINYIDHQEAADEVITEIQSHGVKGIAIAGDVSHPQEVEHLFSKVLAEFGSLDILVNNAGIERNSPFLEMSLEDWQEVINVNLTGYFLCAQQAAKVFQRQGIRPKISCAAGKIILISSVHEIIPWAEHCNYTASKGGVLMFMKSIAQELSPLKIRVNSIAPGAIKTNINRKAWETPKAQAALKELIPYSRLGTTADIANIAVWLASDQTDYIQGTTIFADGGMTLYPAFAHGG